MSPLLRMAWIACLLLTGAFGGCNQNPVPLPEEPSDVTALRPIWVSSEHPEGASQGLSIGNSMLFAPTYQVNNWATAFNLDTRRFAWGYIKQAASFPTYVDGKFIVRHPDGIDVIDEVTGRVLKTVTYPKGVVEFQSRDETYVDRGRFFIHTVNDLLAYDLDQLLGSEANAKPVFYHQIERIMDMAVEPSSGAVAVVHGLNFDALPEGSEYPTYLSVFDRSGNLLWRKTIRLQKPPGPKQSTPGRVGAGNGRIVALASPGDTIAFDVAGNELWRNPAFFCPSGGGTTFYRSVSVEDNLVMLSPSGDNCISGWDARTGERKWVLDAKVNTFDNRPLLLNGVVYASNTFLWAWDAETGEVLGRSGRLLKAQGLPGTVKYHAKRNQLLIWADQIWAFKPLR